MTPPRDRRPRAARSPVLPALLAGFLLACLLLPGPTPAAPPGPPVDFTRDIRPILSDNCFACHGPDKKKRRADLRLDDRDVAVKSGAIVPGDPGKSEVLARLNAHEPKKLMPPAVSGKKLTPQQIDLVRRWIEQGAPYAQHWAFVTPRRPELPKVSDPKWARNPIDHFILARLEKEGLKPSPEADKVTLLRRVTLDLTGLPPTPQEVDDFLADSSPGAYEKVVNRLLKSPRSGEHMARFWLDLARYGDTHGLHLDNYREMWLYRDWVIRAFNDNKPFDTFIIEQLAGDLLPGATTDQVVATGFNRCHVTTSEGGAIAEEVDVRNVVDRVDTTGTVFMGLTVGCCRCHDHKFDPIKTKEYYQLYAFFNSCEGSPLDGNAARYPPILRVPTPEQSLALKDIDTKLEQLRQEILRQSAGVAYDDSLDAKETEAPRRDDFVWVDDALPPGAVPSPDGGINGGWKWVSGPAHPVYSGAQSSTRTTSGLGQHFFTNATPGLRIGAGDKLFAYVYLDPANPPQEVMLQWHSDGWKHRAYWGANKIDWGKDNSPERRAAGPLPEKGKWVRLQVEAAKVGLSPGTVVTGWAFTQFGGTVYWDKAGLHTQTPQPGQSYDTLSAWVRAQRAVGAAGLPGAVQEAIKVDRAKRTPEQQKVLREHFVATAWSKAKASLAPLRKQVTALEQQRQKLDQAMPATLVFKETTAPKPAFILKRGEYDQKGDKVERGTPSFLPPLPEGAPRNRLALARWLVAPDHPLTARVAVNRFWQQVFGTGLVKTSEDFGAQGETPSHPELLDWLAVEFRESGWDTRKLMKMLVTSAAYRQSSHVTKETLARDPANRLLARGPRFRLDAEILRDQALFASGLLAEKLGGPSVKPPQPRGLWEAVAYTGSNTARFTPDAGHEKVHRRSMYIFWKRTAAPPQMTTFDAPSRESCVPRRERTNTPLQALLLLNEKQYVECARVLAERALKEGGAGDEERIAWMFRRVTARKPDVGEVAELKATLKDLRAEYGKDPAAAQKLIAVGETKPDGSLKPDELAAWTMLSNLLLNLDEVITKG